MDRDNDITQQLHSVRDYLRWTVSRMQAEAVYFGHGTDNALDEAIALLFPVLNIPPEARDISLDAMLTQAERLAVVKAVEQRVVDRIPVAYITGEAWFAGMPFQVTRDVLIPRSPLAELIEHQLSPWLPSPATRILDLCTGSGCIGIACAMVFDDAEVDLADISAEALAVARANVDKFGLAARVSVLESDLFQAVEGKRYDVIISNPPYVDEGDLASMPAEYRHEPTLALAAGEDGLDIARRILQQAADYLTEEGILIVEVGNSWVALDDAFPTVPFTWLEFEFGGHGVFVMTRDELLRYRQDFLQV